MNIPPGEYRFKLRAQDMNLAWSKNTYEIKIEKEAQWWQTSWAKMFAFMCGVLLCVIVVRLIALRILNKKLRDQVVQRTKDLVEANNAKSDFLANISHELRTPLNAVIGYSGQLLRKIPDQDSKLSHGLNVILRNGQQLNRLIDDLLDLSKIESGKMTVNLQEIELKTIVEDCIDDNFARAHEKDITLFAPTHYPVERIKADPQRLTQILHNLISNGIKYTDIGKVSVEVFEEVTDFGDRYCVIRVKDTGIGISEDN